MEFYKTIEICCVSLKKTLGLADHYFIIIDDFEYHLGFYSKGLVLPKGSTKGSHIICIKRVCSDCYEKFNHDFETKEFQRLFCFYPLINCESLATGISVQIICMLHLSVALVLVLYKKYLLSIILILILLCISLLFSKYNYSRTVKKKCKHLK